MFELLFVSVLLFYYFWHTIMILHTCVSYEPRRTSINFGFKGSWLTWKVEFVAAGGYGVPLNKIESSEKGLVSTSRTYASPKGTGPGVRRSGVPCLHATPIKNFNFKWMWVWNRVNDIYVYTLSALVYRLHHEQTVLKRTLSVKVRTYKEWLDK